nr:meiotically up-regulated gene 56 protein [Quercus suber]
MTALGPDSYTNRRLEHATAEHVHLTSRRTFVGPIPEGWLNSHRKQWYRRYITTGKERAPTFTAAHPIASSRTQARTSTIPTISVVGDAASEALPRPSSQSAFAESSASATATSVTSLLHDQHQGSSTTQAAVEQSQTERADADGPVERENQDIRGILQRKASGGKRLDRVANKVQSQKVRFSDATKFQLRARAQRLAARGNFRNSKIKDGAVLKMDRMLVRIDITQQSIGADFDERLAQGVETKSIDAWREYMVVCRKHTEGDAESVLQLYKTRVITASPEDYNKTQRNAKINILLSPTRARVNLYSSLDKTLCIWTLEHSRTTIYYLRPQSGAASVEWYTFLRTTLGWKRAQTLQVSVPDLSVTLRLDDPFKEAQTSQLLSDAADGDENALAQVVSDEKGAAGAIVARCVDMLQGSPEWADVLKSWARDDRIGLAWKRYDRLEWVHGAVEQKMYGTIAMQKTHDLELRPKDHYPLKTKTRKGKDLEEPSPLEGFLIRLTSKKGQELRLGKMMFKRLYFTTQDQYLLFLRPANATPPPPPRMIVKSNGNVPSTKELVDKVPLTFAIDPFPLAGRAIEWLGPEAVATSTEQRSHDKDAAAESERNAKMLLASDGFIDLCDVKHIRKMQKGASPADEFIDNGSDVDFDFDHDNDQAADDELQDDGATTELDEDRVFELVMSNGLIIRLQAYSKAARKEWMSHTPSAS